VTETCSSCRSFNPGMEEMSFQPSSIVSIRRQPEPHSPPVSSGTFPPHLHCCLQFFPDMYPSRSSSRSRYFGPSLPDLCIRTVLSCLAPASLIPAALSRGKNDGRENPTSRGERLWTNCYGNRQKPSGLASCLCRFNGNFGSNTDRTS